MRRCNRHSQLTLIGYYVPLSPPLPLPSPLLRVCRVPRTPDPSGVSIVLLASELERIQKASSVLSLQQRRDTEDERKRERELKQVSCRDFPMPTPVVSFVYGIVNFLGCSGMAHHCGCQFLHPPKPSPLLSSPPLPSPPLPSLPSLLLPSPSLSCPPPGTGGCYSAEEGDGRVGIKEENA